MSISPGQRKVVSLSLSPANPNAEIVLHGLKEHQVPQGQRSAKILEWAAAYLSGRANEQPTMLPGFGMSEAELDALLDDF